MALPGMISGSPMPPASAAGVAGAIRSAPLTNARVFASPDFAADLAHLVALLGGGTAGAVTPAAADEPALPAAETGDAVEALCAEVALAVPAATPPVPPPPPIDLPPSAEPDVAPSASEGRAPARTLPVRLAPPGLAVSAEHRSGNAPDDRAMPTLPLLPATASAATAFTVASDETRTAGATRAADPTPTLPTPAALPAEIAPRPAPALHAIVAANVIDVLQPQSSRQIAETVTWHVPAQGVAEVQIRLNPEELGPLDVQLKLDGDKVSVRFDLADERVRDVVQSSLPSLSSMLSARGLQLDQAQVFAQSRGQGSPHQQQPTTHAPEWANRGGADPGEELSVSAVTRPLVRRGLLDDYA